MTQNNIKSLGEFLRQEREKKSVTIEQVASSTKIGVKTLHCLEEDNYKDLPAQPFVRGFVASYARFIGLDPKEVLTEFNDFIATKTEERPKRDKGTVGYVFEKREGEQTRLGLWIVMSILVVGGGIVMFFFKPSIKHRKEGKIAKIRAEHLVSPTPSPTSQTTNQPFVAPSVPTPLLPLKLKADVEVKESSLPVLIIKETPVPVVTPSQVVPQASPSPTLSEKPDSLNSGVNLTNEQIKHRIVVRANTDQWVRYKVDDRPLTRIILRAGRILVLRSEKLARIQVSDPAGASIEYNRTAGKSFNDIDGVQEVRGIKTVVFPSQVAETEVKLFENESPLPKAVPQPAIKVENTP